MKRPSHAESDCDDFHLDLTTRNVSHFERNRGCYDLIGVSLGVTAGILSIVVYSFDFKWIFGPVIRNFGIWTFTFRDDTVEPHGTTTERESLPVAPYVFLGRIQNGTANPSIEDLSEVSQKLLLIAYADLLVINAGQHRIVDHSCDSSTVLAPQSRLETMKKCDCAGAIRAR